MLWGREPLDAVLLLAALEAACLLDEKTAVESSVVELRATLLETARSSSLLTELGEALDLELIPWPASDDASEREIVLQQLVSVIAIRGLLPEPVAARVDLVSEHAMHALAADPGLALGLEEQAGWLADQLDLDPEHPVMRFLGELRQLARGAAQALP
jgi:hypothetical protein